jgi:hypothetical protein
MAVWMQKAKRAGNDRQAVAARRRNAEIQKKRNETVVHACRAERVTGNDAMART